MLLWEFPRELRAGKTTSTVQSWMMKMIPNAYLLATCIVSSAGPIV